MLPQSKFPACGLCVSKSHADSYRKEQERCGTTVHSWGCLGVSWASATVTPSPVIRVSRVDDNTWTFCWLPEATGG